MDLTYQDFLKSKIKRIEDSGFEATNLSPFLFDFQEYIVRRSLKAGRFAIFADCGLGKTLMQLEWANQVTKHTKRPVLILAPLAVSGQTIQEGLKFHINVQKWFVELNTKSALGEGIYITNYEQLDKIDTSFFSGIVLDESSILKNFEGAIRNIIIDGFKHTPYKLACTATPSPNDPMELGNHAEFLNVMSRTEMLAMYFVHDGGETAKWRLKGHSTQSFWDWVSSWAVMLSKPSDLGFNADGYDLPNLNMIERTIKTKQRDNGMLFNDIAVSATDFNAELRITKVERMDQVADIVNNSNENFIIWVKQNEEAEYLRKLIPDAVEVRGSDSPEYKEDKLLGFANNNFRVLITKSKIAQFGMNYQNCNNQIFASLDFSFEALYQSIRRSYRFGQKNAVNIYLLTTDTMQNVVQSIKNKQAQFEQMQIAMTNAINKNLNQKIKMKREFEQYQNEWFDIQLGDCVQLIKNVPSESVGFSVFSPPFSELYVYSDELEDMGNSKDYNEFMVAFNFLVRELYRVMWSGRNVAVHCMDLPIQKGKEGYIGLRDFSGLILSAFQMAGFIYHSRVTIWKDPVVEMQRTKALGLLHKQVKKDSSMSRVGIPDYLMVFRKPGEHLNPVKCTINVDTWQKWASPVWMDINYTNTLNGTQAREERDEKHIAPLQLETIERAIGLWSNEGDTVLTPFMGIGSEVYQAVKMNRKGIGFELKKSYFDQAAKNCYKAVESKKQLSLI
jgi:superfamily II DNA or RNA helicase